MEIYELSNNDNSIIVEVLPEHAGSINKLTFKKDNTSIDVIDGYISDEELSVNKGAKGSLLAPFPNRTRDGKFIFNGATYQFPLNKASENNAIHGFVERERFSVDEHSESGISLSYEYDGSRNYFPFQFLMKVEYVLIDNRLTCITGVRNIGKTDMPFGFGWHPYFSLGERVDDLELHIPSNTEIEVDERMLPTGKLKEFLEFQEPRLISDYSFDTGFVVSDRVRKTSLISDALGVKVEMENGEGYDYLQIYTPPDRKSIAIEPMTCEADALNTKKGLRVLFPEQSFAATYCIKIS